MWNFGSNCAASNISLKNTSLKPIDHAVDGSDDEASSTTGQDEGLECPICWESFNLVENVPYVLWCGHTLCKNCIFGLQWAVVKFPTLPVQMPLLISCPWCNMLSPRFVYKGNLRFPRKNFFLLWMLESMNGDRVKSHSAICGDHQTTWPSNPKASGSNSNNSNQRANSVNQSGSSGANNGPHRANGYLGMERLHFSLRKSLVFVFHMVAKFPLVMIFLMIILYAIPASAAVLSLYIVITLLFGVPSFLLLYFAYPSLDWLVREIVS
ncbi:hypothetical protein Leryth_025125 [Lithospermum erythrorhizon]|nr:hypothetical protein Leryth_025125 [Lithospermum erythrorhizon]